MASPLRRLVVGGAIALILAAACSTEATTTGADRDTSDPITTTDAEPVAEGFDESGIGEEAFTRRLFRDGIFLDVPDSTLIEAGRRICEGFDNGLSFFDMVANAGNEPLLAERPREIGYLIGASTIAFCPEHQDEIP